MNRKAGKRKFNCGQKKDSITRIENKRVSNKVDKEYQKAK